VWLAACGRAQKRDEDHRQLDGGAAASDVRGPHFRIELYETRVDIVVVVSSQSLIIR